MTIQISSEKMHFSLGGKVFFQKICPQIFLKILSVVSTRKSLQFASIKNMGSTSRWRDKYNFVENVSFEFLEIYLAVEMFNPHFLLMQNVGPYEC